MEEREFEFDRIILGDARTVLENVPDESVDLSLWSPPYYVGKSYEKDLDFEEWQDLIKTVVGHHSRVLRKGAFVAVNMADILCFADVNMPRFQASHPKRKRKVTREQVLEAHRRYPEESRYELAARLGCSEQTVQRRLQHNNIRGGKTAVSTKVLLTGAMLAQWAEESGLYLYDRRVWHKDPCWANGRWHASTYRSVDEFEYLYVFWKPGIVTYERDRLSSHEWAQWGSRGVWKLASVSRNDRHEAEFPEKLAERAIRLLTPEKGTVIDPFVGSGTTTAVARKLGRRWLGIELDQAQAQAARRRTEKAR